MLAARFVCEECGKEQNVACNRTMVGGRSLCSDCAGNLRA